MIVAYEREVRALARACFAKAKRVATTISLSHNAQFSESVKYAKAHALENRQIDTELGEKVEPFQGLKGWGAILSFDLRNSTRRAMEIGPHDTYVTMHTFLPTMLDLVGKADGIPVGMRGDGAFACFGLVNMMNRTAAITPQEGEAAIRRACNCADAMVKTMERVINGVLTEGGVKGGLEVGVGIDTGDFVATKIGLGPIADLTAYGDCVNSACKLHVGYNEVIVSHRAQLLFPTKTGGPRIFTRKSRRGDFLGYSMQYPKNWVTLAQ